jgi:hypothetical protein
MSTPIQREAAANDRIGEIATLLKNNGNPSRVANLLSLHYLDLVRESMNGYTPSPHLRDYWGKFYTAYHKLSEKFKKIEDA